MSAEGTGPAPTPFSFMCDDAETSQRVVLAEDREGSDCEKSLDRSMLCGRLPKVKIAMICVAPQERNACGAVTQSVYDPQKVTYLLLSGNCFRSGPRIQGAQPFLLPYRAETSVTPALTASTSAIALNNPKEELIFTLLSNLRFGEMRMVTQHRT